MSYTSIPADAASQPVLVLALVVGLAAAAFAWRDGGRVRAWSVPIALLAATVPLITNQRVLGSDLLYWILFVGAITGAWSGAVAYRAGGRWQVFCLALGQTAFSAPLVAYCYVLAGIYGALMGALLAWLLASPVILVGALCLLSGAADKTRAAACGATFAVSPVIVLDAVFGLWMHGACSVALVALFWASDYMVRNRGPWDRLNPWVEEKAWRIAACTSCVASAYPVFWIFALKQDAFGMPHDLLPIFGSEAIDRAAMFGWMVALCVPIMAWLHPHLRDDKDRARLAGTAVVPLGLWGLAALVVPLDIAIAGLVGAVVLALVTCVGWFITTDPRRAV